ncbi:MAG TPA: YbaK/EbsC family protein [Candidatus Acidoferrales bacterium]|nr:YbaK/EbsC family protein [Candidatus Acidoferrales bacterium]HXK07080.1 YbaK/EbsC family protein [Verrucomicrobiae bacterium]
MPILPKLQELLDLSGVPYTHTVHPLAYTAREVANAEHVPPQEVAKVVVIVADGEYKMAVLPASRVLDFPEVRAVLGSPSARLATEDELGRLFPDCELGAMPPFGNLYHMKVLVDASLLADEQIAFNAGTHRDVVHMRLEDYRRMAQPEVASLAREPVAR